MHDLSEQLAANAECRPTTGEVLGELRSACRRLGVTTRVAVNASGSVTLEVSAGRGPLATLASPDNLYLEHVVDYEEFPALIDLAELRPTRANLRHRV